MIGLVDFSNPNFNYPNKGYTAIINQMIDISIDHYLRYNNIDLIISDEQILEFFDLKHKFDKYDYNSSNNFLVNFFNGQTRHNIFNAHTIANKDDLFLRNKIFNQILTPKDFVLDEINNLLSSFNIDDNTLGLQIRGTDKINEIPKIPDDIIITSIIKELNNNKLTKIFLSTDDNYYLELIKDNFNDKLIYNYNNIISYNGSPIHFSDKKTNKDVLLDVFLLSNCKHFLYCFSNVSYLALTLGVHKQINIKNLNNYEN